MIHRLPANCLRNLFHLWARLETDTAINEATPLNRAELCECVVFLHIQSILNMLMNGSQTADQLLKKIILFVGEAGHRRNHKWSNSFESRRIVWKCSFFYTVNVVWICSWMIHRLLTNCRQKIISFVAEAAHRRNHKLSNSSESRRIVRKCSYFYTVKAVWLCSWMIHSLRTNCRQKIFHLWARLHTDATVNGVTPLNPAELCEIVFFTQAKYSDYAHEWFTDCRRIDDESYFICWQGWI